MHCELCVHCWSVARSHTLHMRSSIERMHHARARVRPARVTTNTCVVTQLTIGRMWRATCMRTCSGDRLRGHGRPMDDTCMQLRSTNGQMWATNGATIDRKHLHGDSRVTHGAMYLGCERHACTPHTRLSTGLATVSALSQSIFEYRRPEKRSTKRRSSATAVKHVKKIETKNENVT